MEFIKQQARFPAQEEQKQTQRQAFLAQMRQDWGGRTIKYHGPMWSIGSYVPTSGKLAVVARTGPSLFLPEPVQVIVWGIDDDGWVTLMVGFDRQEQPRYRYIKVEVLQRYAEEIRREEKLSSS